MGFPVVATPLIALALDVKTAIAVTIVPNAVMDGLQVVRGGDALATVRRLVPVLAFGVPGTIFGTYLLVLLSAETASIVLGVFILVFVSLGAARRIPRIPAHWERPLAPVVGLLAGALNGLTNASAPPLALYFQALGMDKREFARSIGLVFVTVKVVQLGATLWYRLLTWPLLLASLGLTAVGLVGFAAGLRLQDRLPETAFRRVLMGFLALSGLWLVVRGLG